MKATASLSVLFVAASCYTSEVGPASCEGSIASGPRARRVEAPAALHDGPYHKRRGSTLRALQAFSESPPCARNDVHLLLDLRHEEHSAPAPSFPHCPPLRIRGGGAAWDEQLAAAEGLDSLPADKFAMFLAVDPEGEIWVEHRSNRTADNISGNSTDGSAIVHIPLGGMPELVAPTGDQPSNGSLPERTRWTCPVGGVRRPADLAAAAAAAAAAVASAAANRSTSSSAAGLRAQPNRPRAREAGPSEPGSVPGSSALPGGPELGPGGQQVRPDGSDGGPWERGVPDLGDLGDFGERGGGGRKGREEGEAEEEAGGGRRLREVDQVLVRAT